MASEKILDQIRLIMNDVFDLELEEADITPDTSAEDVEEWDSLSHIRLMVAIERKFNVKFKNSEIESLKRLGDLVALVDAKVA